MVGWPTRRPASQLHAPESTYSATNYLIAIYNVALFTRELKYMHPSMTGWINNDNKNQKIIASETQVKL